MKVLIVQAARTSVSGEDMPRSRPCAPRKRPFPSLWWEEVRKGGNCQSCAQVELGHAVSRRVAPCRVVQVLLGSVQAVDRALEES